MITRILLISLLLAGPVFADWLVLEDGSVVADVEVESILGEGANREVVVDSGSGKVSYQDVYAIYFKSDQLHKSFLDLLFSRGRSSKGVAKITSKMMDFDTFKLAKNAKTFLPLISTSSKDDKERIAAYSVTEMPTWENLLSFYILGMEQLKEEEIEQGAQSLLTAKEIFDILESDKEDDYSMQDAKLLAQINEPLAELYFDYGFHKDSFDVYWEIYVVVREARAAHAYDESDRKLALDALEDVFEKDFDLELEHIGIVDTD